MPKDKENYQPPKEGDKNSKEQLIHESQQFFNELHADAWNDKIDFNYHTQLETNPSVQSFFPNFWSHWFT